MLTKTKIEEKIERIKEILANNYPKEDLSIIDKAFEIASKAHEGQKRASGEPYITHPVEVALTLAEMKMDPETVAAGLLHDVLEDSGVSKETLENTFGKDITFLVESVTKLSKIEAKSPLQREVEPLRKMLLAMAQDIRVIIIKLADRLHNMRTLHYIQKEEKRKRIAQETLDIYAPIAHRFGLARIKWELEDLAFKELNPSMYRYIETHVAKSREERERLVNELIEFVKKRLEEKGIKAHVEGRPKHFYSIYKKMVESNLSFEELYDLIALRIIVNTVDECYIVLGIIHSLWPHIPGRFKDYIAMPKPNMYQSLHTTVVGPKGEKIEFQIRTWEMHRVAEEGIAAHWKYKEKIKEVREEDKVYSWLRRVIEMDKDVDNYKEFIKNLKLDLFPEKIYVFTPKGDILTLPKGATALDFAYAIHTEVGHHCAGAKVDGRLVPLDYELKSGEKIEIITSPHQKPSKDWLRIVKTSRARIKILAWIRAQEKEQAIETGKNLLSRELKKRKLALGNLMEEGKLQEIATQLGYNNVNDLFIGMGLGKISIQSVLNKIIEPQEKPKKEKTKERSKPSLLISIGGMENISARFAKCCTPIPGDPVIGYITKGKGITVHRKDCPMINTSKLDPERIIDVEWHIPTKQRPSLPVKIKVETIDQPGMLAKITTVMSQENVNIESAIVKTTSDKRAYLEFVIDVTGKDHLTKVLNQIQKIDGILLVERM
ncbi:MAG: RelA/SpoT family protein [Thermosulfidibacteraceae bacterium]|jgi:GTP pyrophosphokinase